MFFKQECECLKSVNHTRNILKLYHSKDDWFQSVIWYSGLVDLCSYDVYTIWRRFPSPPSHKEKLLDHSGINCNQAHEMMIIYLGVDPMDAQCSVREPEVLMQNFHTCKISMKTTWSWPMMPTMMIYKLPTTRSVLWIISSYSWLTRSYLWTKVKPTPIWHIVSTSLTCRSFTSGTRGPPVRYTCTPSWAKVLFGRQSKWQTLHPIGSNFHSH